MCVLKLLGICSCVCNFSFSQSVFKRLVTKTQKNQGLFGKGLKECQFLTVMFISQPSVHLHNGGLIHLLDKSYLASHLTHYQTMPHFDAQKIYSCGNILRKGEIAWNKRFLLVSHCFLPYMALTF